MARTALESREPEPTAPHLSPPGMPGQDERMEREERERRQLISEIDAELMLRSKSFFCLTSVGASNPLKTSRRHQASASKHESE